MKKNLPALKTIGLDFYWVDGKGPHQKLAKIMAKKVVSVRQKKLDDLTIIHAHFTEKHFLVASKIFELIGRTKTTTITAKGLPTLTKRFLADIFWCFECSLRSRSKDYCGITIPEVKNNSAEIAIHVQTFGINVSNGENQVVKRRKKPVRHPCQLCFYATPREKRDSSDTYLKALPDVADMYHAWLCPKFKLK